MLMVIGIWLQYLCNEIDIGYLVLQMTVYCIQGNLDVFALGEIRFEELGMEQQLYIFGCNCFNLKVTVNMLL